ncbi:UNVERIFIED_CONTAM: hypothetical protein K2H54_063554, partial [Gekko kuhli]
GLLVPKPDSSSTMEEAAGDPFVQNPEKNDRLAEADGLQKTLEGEQQQLLLKGNYQRRNMGMKQKRGSVQEIAQECYHQPPLPGGAVNPRVHSLPSLPGKEKATSEQPPEKDFWFPDLIPYPQWKKQEIHLSKTQRKERDQQRVMVPRTSPRDKHSSL